MYNEEVINFIKRFQNEGTIKTFTQGCCYWFAKILDERFNCNDIYDLERNIYYNGIDNHFATLIDNHLYDITGDLGNIKDLFEWERWYDFMEKDYLLTERIFRDCINF